jgi:hypothetical protein
MKSGRLRRYTGKMCQRQIRAYLVGIRVMTFFQGTTGCWSTFEVDQSATRSVALSRLPEAATVPRKLLAA